MMFYRWRLIGAGIREKASVVPEFVPDEEDGCDPARSMDIDEGKDLIGGWELVAEDETVTESMVP